MVHLESTCSPNASDLGEQQLMWLFLAGIGGCKALEYLDLDSCRSLASLPEGGSPTPHTGTTIVPDGSAALRRVLEMLTMLFWLQPLGDACYGMLSMYAMRGFIWRAPVCFGVANHAVLVAALGECTQLKELDLNLCSNLKSLPDSE